MAEPDAAQKWAAERGLTIHDPPQGAGIVKTTGDYVTAARAAAGLNMQNVDELVAFCERQVRLAKYAEGERQRLAQELEAMTAARDHCKQQTDDASSRYLGLREWLRDNHPDVYEESR